MCFDEASTRKHDACYPENRLSIHSNFRLVTNVDASVAQLPEQDARDALIRQIPNPVLWWQSIDLLIREGVNTFIEVGAGKVLTGMIRKVSRDVQTFNVENVDDYEQLRAKYQS